MENKFEKALMDYGSQILTVIFQYALSTERYEDCAVIKGLFDKYHLDLNQSMEEYPPISDNCAGLIVQYHAYADFRRDVDLIFQEVLDSLDDKLMLVVEQGHQESARPILSLHRKARSLFLAASSTLLPFQC